MTDHLQRIVASLQGHLGEAERRGAIEFTGLERAKIDALLVEARDEIKDRLGFASEFGQRLSSIRIPVRGQPILPTPDDVRGYVAMIGGAIRAIERKGSQPAPPAAGTPPPPAYIDPSRIVELKALKPGPHDFTRLAELCRELNVAAAGNAHMATAMIVRAIVDHVPPALGCKTFGEVASSYAGSRSFKTHMASLQNSLRNVADGHLHTQIRKRETLPTGVEVDFRSAVGELVGEVIRVAKAAGT